MVFVVFVVGFGVKAGLIQVFCLSSKTNPGGHSIHPVSSK